MVGQLEVYLKTSDPCVTNVGSVEEREEIDGTHHCYKQEVQIAHRLLLQCFVVARQRQFSLRFFILMVNTDVRLHLLEDWRRHLVVHSDLRCTERENGKANVNLRVGWSLQNRTFE